MPMVVPIDMPLGGGGGPGSFPLPGGNSSGMHSMKGPIPGMPSGGSIQDILGALMGGGGGGSMKGMPGMAGVSRRPAEPYCELMLNPPGAMGSQQTPYGPMSIV